jgi:hypothetical protein
VAIPEPFTFETGETGAFGRRGGIITTNVLGDDKLELGFVKLAGYIEDTFLPLKAAEGIAKADIHNRFQVHKDPEGDDWDELSDTTVKRKARDPRLRSFPEDILTLSGAMEKQATADDSFIIADDELVWTSEHMPRSPKGFPYWQVHQSNENTFETIALTKFVPGKGHVETGESARFATTEGPGHATPARPFIGLSQEAEEQILAVFDQWYDEGVSIAINPSTGVVQERVGGRFGGRLFPRSF